MNVRNPHLSIIAAGAVALMITAAFLASAGDAGAAPNLVVNGTFDTGPGVSPWGPSAGTTLAQIPSEDANLNPSSGAISVTIASGGTATASQCINLTGVGNGTYQIVGSYKSPVGTIGTNAQLNVAIFDDTVCGGPPVPHPSGNLPGWQPAGFPSAGTSSSRASRQPN